MRRDTSLPLTSNPAPAEWPDPFRHALLASAGLGRLADKAPVPLIAAAGYRPQGRRHLEEE